MRVGIIGGGAAGLAAAYELTKQGHFAEVFEAAPFLGGQASTFEVGGGQLERGYHHLFVSDTDMVELIEELGLGDSMEWLESKVGLFHGGSGISPRRWICCGFRRCRSRNASGWGCGRFCCRRLGAGGSTRELRQRSGRGGTWGMRRTG